MANVDYSSFFDLANAAYAASMGRIFKPNEIDFFEVHPWDVGPVWFL